MVLAAFDLSEVRVAVLLPKAPMRAAIRDIVGGIGIFHYTDYEDIARLRNALDQLPPDLLLLILDENYDPPCALVRDIRHGAAGRDPYLVTVALTWSAEGAVINAAINAGSDDIVTLPLSIRTLRERIANLIERRKGFVATATYVGPDRRAGKRARFDGPGAVSVPNNLRYKATGDESAAARPDAIEKTARAMKDQRIHRIAARISHVASDMKEYALLHPLNPVNAEGADEMAALAGEIAAQIESSNDRNLSRLNQSLGKILAAVLHAHTLDPRLFDIVELHGQAIRVALSDAGNAGAIVTQALDRASAFIRRHAKA